MNFFKIHNPERTAATHNFLRNLIIDGYNLVSLIPVLLEKFKFLSPLKIIESQFLALLKSNDFQVSNIYLTRHHSPLLITNRS